ncbi:MAG: sulfite exporter TauE/SafE family protein [Cyclobacteriaceae bacterium]
MEILIISLAAFITALLTFFSGFGLGTILTPVFIIFFPVDLAIALTGVVHFFNNLFKLFLVGKRADKAILIKFGIPAILAAFVGALIMINLSSVTPLFSYYVGAHLFKVTPLKFIIGILLILFSLIDLIPYFKKLEFNQNKIPLGGALSGFFGGLSGHQGALRSAFLINAGLSKEVFVGTSVVIATFIDFTRLSVYASRFGQSGLGQNLPLVISATFSAFAGAYLGNRLLDKITLSFIQKLVAILLLLISISLTLGII